MRKWVAFAFLPVCFATVQAQNASQTPSVVVRSNPSGATVMLSGDYNVAGITPTTFTQRLSGYYRITAYREGYETYRSSVILSGSQSATIDIKLVAKTRARAALRSFVVPGWGQRYYGSKTKGTLITIGALAGGATLGLMHLHFDNKRDDYFEVLDRYRSKRSVAEKEAMLGELYDAQKAAYDAEQNRNIAGAILAGFWIYNLLDTFLFFPDYGISISGTQLSFAPEFDKDGLKITGTVKFR